MAISAIARRRSRCVVGVLVALAFPIAGCGSNASVSPTSPSPAAVTAQYPSLVGEWGGGGSLTIYYPDGRVFSYGCDGGASVRTQTGGTFSGLAELLGHSLDTDKQCPNAFAFTANMTPDGKIIALQTAEPMGLTPGCMALSGVSFNRGTASNEGFSVVMTDHAMCRSPVLDPREPYSLESDRTITLSIDRRRPSPPS